MPKTLFAMFASLMALAAMTWALVSSDVRKPVESSDVDSAAGEVMEVSLFCAASNQPVMEEIRAEYQRETGRRVAIQYGASQTLLSQLEVAGAGDLYLPADDSFIQTAQQKHLVS